jgi:hypothetical protein
VRFKLECFFTLIFAVLCLFVGHTSQIFCTALKTKTQTWSPSDVRIDFSIDRAHTDLFRFSVHTLVPTVTAVTLLGVFFSSGLDNCPVPVYGHLRPKMAAPIDAASLAIY